MYVTPASRPTVRLAIAENPNSDCIEMTEKNIPTEMATPSSADPCKAYISAHWKCTSLDLAEPFNL